MRPQRCPGCRRNIRTVEDGADHEDCLREWQIARSRELEPKEPR